MATKSNVSPRADRRHFAVGRGAWVVFLVTAIGAWWASLRLVEARHGPAKTAVENRAKLIQRLQGENERLQAEQRALAAQSPGAESPAPALEPEAKGSAQRDAKRIAGLELFVALETIGAVSQNTPLHDYFRVQNSDGRLPDGFGRFFDLSPDEFEKLQAVLKTTKQHLEAAALAGTTVRRESDAKLVLEIKVATEWAVQRERLRDAFLEVLGPEQMRIFERLSRGIDRACETMETQDWSVVLTRVPMSAGGNSGFGYEQKGTNRVSIRSTRDPGVPRRTIVNNLGRWAQFLPADF